MNYLDSVQFLYSLGNELKTAKFGLERITAVLEAMGRPHRRGRFVHVAGTNGKGSACAMIAGGLHAAGYRTGLYTSPHLLEPTERIRIDGVPIGADEFAAAFDRVHETAERMLAGGKLDFHPTYFETVTAMGFYVFAERAVDIVVLEVGLGGRLDATNVVQPELCVITPVDFDHEAYLGKDIESIAGEKAGILKAGAPAVVSAQRPAAERVILRRAAELRVPVSRSADWRIDELVLDKRGSDLVGPFHVRCPLAGEHQVENARTAIVALERIGITEESIAKGIGETVWNGRLERISEDPEIIVDGAHNPAGARALATYLDRFYGGLPKTLIFGAMRDKAVDEIAGLLFPRFTDVIVTAPKQARALAPEAYAEISGRSDLRVAKTVSEALAIAEKRHPIFVTGSLFLVAEAMQLV